MARMTVRDLMRHLVEMNPDASVQLMDDEKSKYMRALGRVIYHAPEGGKDNRKKADFVALIPD